MTPTMPLRALALSAAIATVAAALVTFPAVSVLPVSGASAATAFCATAVDTRYGNLHTAATIPEVLAGATETGVTAYIEGDFTALNGGQETEGQFIVGGDANFFTHAYTNIGVVGIGSQVSPVPGTDVLVTGGNIAIGTGTPATTTVEVSHWSDGNIVAGGAVTVGAGDSLTFNGAGGQTSGAAAPLAPYAAVPTLYSTMSTFYAAQSATGTVTTSASAVTFTGDGTSALQVFTVANGSVLGTLAASKKLSFVNIPADAVVIINVTDSTAVISTNQLVALNGVDVSWSVPYATDPTFSHFTQSLLWNFPTATDITFGNGSQIPGSIVAPSADLTLLASTNGRVYVGGDVELGDLAGTQSGLEMHNYGFRGFDCSTTGGSLAITKALNDPSDIVDDDRAFTGTYTCDPAVGADITGTWSVTAGATQTVTGLPDGATCTIDEDALTAPPHATDTSYVWATPTFSADQVIADGTTVTITATNSFTRETGSFSITKSLSDPDSVVDTDREFTGTYSCQPLSGAAITGTWSLEAGDTQTSAGFPAGSTCTILEDALNVAPSADPSYAWGAPTYSPTSVVTGDGTTVTITAINTVTHDSGSLAITKSLSDPADIVDDAREFTGTYSCDPTTGADITGTWSVAVGATQTVTGLPAGAVCTIVEDSLATGPSADTSYVWGTPTYSPTSGTITTGGTVTLTAQNSFSRQTGSFAITKALTDPDGVVADDREFTGSYTCDPQSGADITGTWSVEAGVTQTVTGVPVGSSCSIVEDTLSTPPSSTDSSYTWGAPTYSPSTVTTTTGTVTITATNTVLRGFGSISVVKVLNDPDSVVDPLRDFTGTISCTVGTPSPSTWSVKAGGAAATFTGIPAGAECTILEDALTVAPSSIDSSYVWQPSQFLTPNVITVVDDATATVQVLNQVRRALGDLELVKVLDDPYDVVSLSRVYTGTYECSHLGADVTQGSGTWSTTAGAPAITLATNLPAGTVCTVAEDAATLTAPPLAGFPQYIWRAPVITPAVITIADDVTGRFTVTNIVYDPFDLLAATGTDAAMPLLIGGGALAAGVMAVLLGYRRRRSA